MLLRIGVKNLWSIREYQELSLIASALKDESSDIFSPEGIREKVLPSVGIYGANASGKSNILKSITSIRSMVLHSHTQWSASGGVPRVSFALDSHAIKENSKLDCDFVIDGVRYHYGFIFDDEKFTEEWLYAYPRGRRQVWFYRNSSMGRIKFGEEFHGPNRTAETVTRPNSLFLSAAAQSNHEKALNIYKFFDEKFIVNIYKIRNGANATINKYLENEKTKKRIIDVMKSADIGVSDMLIEETKFSAEQNAAFGEVVNTLKRYFIKDETDVPDIKMKDVKLGHNSSDRGIVYFSMDQESQGTVELLSLIGPITESLEEGKILVVDEINTSLHPILTMSLLALYASKETNPHGAQLIFSTHDSNVLSAQSLRRDQIWFTEKSVEGQTRLYPLTDIVTRKSDNFQKGYLQGRFGAVPFLGGIEMLFKEGTYK